MHKVRHALAFCVSLALFFCGCASLHLKRKPKAPPPPAAGQKPKRTAAPEVDAKAQQTAYDRGLTLFSEEKYPEARDAWREAVRLGPRTSLGQKSREHLQKVEKILENLRQIERQ